jgi:HlyD family secretion protein
MTEEDAAEREIAQLITGTRARPRRRRWAIVIAVAVAAAVTAVGLHVRRDNRLLSVAVVHPRVGTFTRTVDGFGRVVATQVDLVFGAEGRVSEVFVQPRDVVSVGAAIAALDAGSMHEDVKRSVRRLGTLETSLSARLAQHDSDLLQLQHQLAVQERNAETNQELFDRGAIPQRELDSALAAVEELQLRIESLEAQTRSNLASIRAEIQDAKTAVESLVESIGATILRSTIAGVIEDVYVSPGEHVGAGSVATRILQSGTIRVEAYFAQNDAIWIETGQDAEFRPDSRPDVSIAAHVRSIAVTARVDPVGASLLVALDLDSSSVTPFFTGTVSVTINRIEDAVLLPVESVVEEDDCRSVQIVDSETGMVRRQTITVVDRSFTEAAVSGVAPADLVVALPSRDTADGERVNPRLGEDRQR